MSHLFTDFTGVRCRSSRMGSRSSYLHSSMSPSSAASDDGSIDDASETLDDVQEWLADGGEKERQKRHFLLWIFCEGVEKSSFYCCEMCCWFFVEKMLDHVDLRNDTWYNDIWSILTNKNWENIVYCVQCEFNVSNVMFTKHVNIRHL